MSNYTPTGAPPAQTRGISSSIRNEFALIQTAINSKASTDTASTYAVLQTYSAGITVSGGYTISGGGTLSAGTYDYTAATLLVATPSLADSSTTASNTSWVRQYVAQQISLVNTQAVSIVVPQAGTSFTAVAGNVNNCTNGAVVTATLPATPSAGDRCDFIFTNGLALNVIQRNGNTIMGLAQDLTIDNITGVAVELRYIGSDWRLI